MCVLAVPTLGIGQLCPNYKQVVTDFTVITVQYSIYGYCTVLTHCTCRYMNLPVVELCVEAVFIVSMLMS